MGPNTVLLFKWVGNDKEDTAFPSHEAAQAFCNWINTKENIETSVSNWDLPKHLEGKFGIDNRWVNWEEAREFAELFDLEVVEERGLGEQSCMT